MIFDRTMHKKTIIITLVTILILSGAGGAYYYMAYVRNNNSGSSGSQVPYSPDNISKLISHGDMAQAKVVVQDELKKNDTLDVRRQLVTVELASNEYSQVIDTYSSVISSAPASLSAQDLNNIALAYEKVGDKTNAAIYYRKAAAVWPTNDPMHDAEVEYLINQANFLEGKVNA